MGLGLAGTPQVPPRVIYHNRSYDKKPVLPVPKTVGCILETLPNEILRLTAVRFQARALVLCE